jgi:hydrogenase maturation protease
MILCIAIGNSLRGDDGVAHRVLQLINAGEGVSLRKVVQLTPEIAADIATAQRVIFIDADPLCVKPRIEPVTHHALRRTPLAHGMSPAEVVSLANYFYGFASAAFLCRVPASNFDGSQELSPQAEAGARAAAHIVQKLL